MWSRLRAWGKGCLQWLWERCVEYRGAIVSAMGAIGLTLVGIFLAIPHGTAVIAWIRTPLGVLSGVFAAAQVWGSVDLARQNKGSRQLRRDYEKLRDTFAGIPHAHEAAIGNYLLGLFSDLGLSSHDRVSLYRYSNGQFIPMGRHASNPGYALQGRRAYAAHEGCIAEAWKNGECEANDLPDPRFDMDAYCQFTAARWRIPISTVEGFKMKSRCYYACTLESTKGRAEAVIVFESVDKSSLDFGKIRNKIRKERKYIKSFLELIKAAEPDPTTARAEGY